MVSVELNGLFVIIFVFIKIDRGKIDSMEEITERLDNLAFSKEKSVLKMLEVDEKILMTCMITKFNRKNKR